MSLKLKISLLVSALLVLVIGGFAGAFYASEARALADAQRDRQRETAAALGEVCREAMIGQQYLGITNYLKRLKGSPEVREAWCIDGSGEILGHTDVRLVHTRMGEDVLRRATEASAPAAADRDGAVEALAPVAAGGRRAGTAGISFSPEELRRRFQENLGRARRRILNLTAAALALGFAGAFLVTALALKPLGPLVEGVRTVGRGKLDHQIPIDSRDELAWLAREFNAMAGKLQELDRMKQDFVNGVTHDLKSPLAAVKVALDLLQEEAEKAEAGRADAKAMADNLFAIRRSMERLGHMISSLLETAKIESGVQLDLRDVNLEDVAARVVKSFGLIARQKGLALDLVVETAVPPIRGDGDKMERAVANLVSNALKFTEKGGVRVHVADLGDRQEVRVADSGPGIPPEALERLFSKFFRVRGPGEKLEGTGLGLSITKGLVEAHGGRVSVESRPGAGAVFTASFPKAAPR